MLKERITAGIKDVNRYPVIHTWSYKLAEAARYDSNQGNADLVDIEACASSHRWSRELQALRHTVRLMPPALTADNTDADLRQATVKAFWLRQSCRMTALREEVHPY